MNNLLNNKMFVSLLREIINNIQVGEYEVSEKGIMTIHVTECDYEHYMEDYTISIDLQEILNRRYGIVQENNHIDQIVIGELSKYYPKRVQDYKDKLIELEILPLESNESFLKTLREKESASDNRMIIVGFEKAILFLDSKDMTTTESERLNKEIKSLKSSGLLKTKDISDSYHTFGELYEHRMAFNVALTEAINQMNLDDTYAYKSMKHHDGSMFDGMFIVVIESPLGQISYHYNLEHWDDFYIPVREQALEYDGHTPQDTIKRLVNLFYGHKKDRSEIKYLEKHLDE
jgi:hypothetical protein